MVKTRQRPTSRSHVVGWCCGIFFATMLLPVVALGQDGPQRLTSSTATVQDLLASGETLEGKHVVIEGKVVNVSHVADVISGVSMYFFTVSDGTGKIQIASPMGVMFVEGDHVRVKGIYQGPGSHSSESSFIDASEGTIEVLEASKSKLGQMLRPTPGDMASVPVAPVTTPWSRGAELAAIVSAVFAFFASAALLLRMRRFNIGLTLAIVESSLRIEAGRLRVKVRAISTRSYPPQVRPDAELKTPRLERIRGNVLGPDPDTNGRAGLIPIPVFTKETLSLEFPMPKDARVEDLASAKVVLQDVLCRKRFVMKLRATNSSCVGRNRPVQPPVQSFIGDNPAASETPQPSENT